METSYFMPVISLMGQLMLPGMFAVQSVHIHEVKNFKMLHQCYDHINFPIPLCFCFYAAVLSYLQAIDCHAKFPTAHCSYCNMVKVLMRG